ncbi:MAG: DUF881 domain-containing protein [Tetrasphaera sp.]
MTRASASGPPARRLDESMTLLTSMQERPLDPGYAAAAQRRRRSGQPASVSVRTPGAFAAALLVGLVLSVGAMALRSGASDSAVVRANLIERIESRRVEADDRAAHIAATEGEIAGLESAALEQGRFGGVAARVEQLRLAAGTVAVTGPGLVVTLDDDPRARDTPADGEGIVLSRDLAIVVNALWAAGAEAIAIDDQRLSARSAIRFAGDAILVNFRPLVPPYAIEAIGDPESLPAAFAQGDGAAYLKSLSDNFGVVTDVTIADHVDLPAASGLTTSLAKPLEPGR